MKIMTFNMVISVINYDGSNDDYEVEDGDHGDSYVLWVCDIYRNLKMVQINE